VVLDLNGDGRSNLTVSHKTLAGFVGLRSFNVTGFDHVTIRSQGVLKNVRTNFMVTISRVHQLYLDTNAFHPYDGTVDVLVEDCDVVRLGSEVVFKLQSFAFRRIGALHLSKNTFKNAGMGSPIKQVMMKLENAIPIIKYLLSIHTYVYLYKYNITVMLVVFTFSHFSVNRFCRVIWYIILIAKVRFNFHYTIPMLFCRVVNTPNDLFSSKSASRVITSFSYLFQFASCNYSYIIIVCIDHTITTVRSAIANIHLRFNIDIYANQKPSEKFLKSDFVERTTIEIDECLFGYSRQFSKNKTTIST